MSLGLQITISSIPFAGSTVARTESTVPIILENIEYNFKYIDLNFGMNFFSFLEKLQSHIVDITRFTSRSKRIDKYLKPRMTFTRLKKKNRKKIKLGLLVKKHPNNQENSGLNNIFKNLIINLGLIFLLAQILTIIVK